MAHFRIEDLTFQYPTAAAPSLNGVSLSIEKGSYAVLCGQSGSGKTTLLRHLKSVLTPHGKRSGKILLEGTDLAQIPAAETELFLQLHAKIFDTISEEVYPLGEKDCNET